jgi:hypothetical protein
MDFVEPALSGKRVGIELDNSDCALVGIDEQSSEKNGARVQNAWFFSIHPAIANTLVAEDAMRLDMLLAHPPVESLAPDLKGVSRPTYQWYDIQSNIEVSNGRVLVSPRDGKNSPLMRFRIWEQTIPDWARDQRSAKDSEFLKRFKLTAEKVGVLDTPACRLAIWNVEARELILLQLEDPKAFESKRASYFKEHQIEGSDPWVLQQSQEGLLKDMGRARGNPDVKNIVARVGEAGEKISPGFKSRAMFFIWSTEVASFDANVDLTGKTLDEIALMREQASKNRISIARHRTDRL